MFFRTPVICFKSLSKVLEAINERIEVLLDRDHTIGHLYFLKLKSGEIKGLKSVFANNIIPLLHEELGSGIYIEQKAIGFIGSYELNVEKFNPDEIQFKLLELTNKYLLQNITYHEVPFKLRNKESTINYQNSFEVI